MKISILCILFSLSISSGFGQTKADWDSLYPEETGERNSGKQVVLYQPGPFESTGKLNHLLDSLALQDLRASRIAGYRILLYSGNEREGATKARENAYRVFQKADLYTSYNAPTFKVRFGDFYRKLDAYNAFLKLKFLFPQAVIVQEIVNLKP